METRQLMFILLATLLFSIMNAYGDISNPKNVKPIRYTLTVETNLEVHENCSTFNGSVTMELFSSQTATNITLHSRKLDIDNSTIRVVHSSGAKVDTASTEIDEENELYIIYLKDELAANEYYNLTIEAFSGIMTYDKIGFYLVQYTNKDGEERYTAVTDFEPRDARKAFPCFDHPSMKAKFIINIIRPPKYFALSNEELISTKDLGNGRFIDTFKETMILPTYAVAFMVSDFKHTQKVERHRVFAKPDAIDDGRLDYALSTAVEMLKALEEYTGVNYTNTKMDQVAIPGEYYQDEAMENWGLVTYSQKNLFISNKTSSIDSIESTTLFVAHEFAHQWFGNLVTLKEWEHMWLNEGFAQFFQYYIASLVRHSWKLMDRFVIDILGGVFDIDSTNSTESISNCSLRDADPWLIMSICYRKASVIIRMTQHFLTSDRFRRGIHLYLEENKFKNTEPKDLYSAFQKIIDEENAQNDILGNNSISSIMETWISNKGFPLVTVQRNYDNQTVTFSQKRYLKEGDVKTDTVWYIPISYVYQLNPNRNFSDTRADVWLTEKDITVADESEANGWFLINKQQGGYYRVNYDLPNWERLSSFLQKDDYGSIHVLNRAQLIDDAFRLARRGDIPYHVPLNLSKYLAREIDYVPFELFVDALFHLEFVMSSSRLYDVFRNYVIDLFSTVYDSVGFKEKSSDTHLDKFKRIIIIRWLCNSGYMKCRKDALERFHEWRNTGVLPVSFRLRYAILCHSLRIADIDDWEFVFAKAMNDTKTRPNIYFGALSCSENEFILNDYLSRIFNSTVLQDSGIQLGVFRTITRASSVGLKVAMNFITSMPEKMQMKAVSYVSEKCTTQEQFEEMQALNTTLPKETLQKGLDIISKNIQLIKDSYKEDIENWFYEYSTANTESSNTV